MVITVPLAFAFDAVMPIPVNAIAKASAPTRMLLLRILPPVVVVVGFVATVATVVDVIMTSQQLAEQTYASRVRWGVGNRDRNLLRLEEHVAGRERATRVNG